MTQNLNYLTDEELELMIADVEQNDLVMAPPDLLEGILERINETEPHTETDDGKLVKSVSNIREFRRYCFRVCASVAATIAFIFVLPAMSDNWATNLPEQDEYVMEQKYATKEDALIDRNYLSQKFEGNKIFGGNQEIGIFKQ